MKNGSDKLQGQVVFGYFKIIKKIGTGAFGQIFEVQHTSKQQKFALKIQPVSTRHPQLLFEAKLYKYIHHEGSIEGFPHVYAAGVEKGYNMMLMDKLGQSLQDFCIKKGGKLSLKTVLMIGVQLIDRIKYFHQRGFIHRDIKPDNLLMGLGNKSKTMFIIDMGLSKKYYVKERHIPYKEGKQLTGTARYASISTHKGIQQSRRDDIETIGYVLMYFLRGILPWQNMKAKNAKAKYQMIMFKKISTSLQSLCQGFPGQFVALISYARGLKFEEEPDYEYVRGLLMKAAQEREIEFDYVYDWESL